MQSSAIADVYYLSFLSCFIFSFLLLFSFFFPSQAERQSLGESLLFLQFAAIAGAAVAFEYLLVPETRGLSLEEVFLNPKAYILEPKA